MKKRLLIGLLGIIAFCSWSGLYSKVLIFDLSEVLIETSELRMWGEIGRYDAAVYRLTASGDDLERAVFATLSLAGEQKSPKAELVLAPSGHTLPLIMCQWLAGNKKGSDILDVAPSLIEEFSQRKGYRSDRERRLVYNIIKAIFDPHTLAQNTVTIFEGEQLLKECLEARGRDGKRHRLLIYANWDPLSFEVLYKADHVRPIFKYFNQKSITISGTTHLLQPHASSYKHLIKKYNLDPKECVMISAQEELIQGASAQGIKGVLVRDRDYFTARQELKKLGVIG